MVQRNDHEDFWTSSSFFNNYFTNTFQAYVIFEGYEEEPEAEVQLSELADLIENEEDESNTENGFNHVFLLYFFSYRRNCKIF